MDVAFCVSQQISQIVNTSLFAQLCLSQNMFYYPQLNLYILDTADAHEPIDKGAPWSLWFLLFGNIMELSIRLCATK